MSVFAAAVVALALLLFPRAASAFTVPPSQGAVTDTAGVLSFEDDAALEEQIATYRRRTGHEIGVLVVRSTGGDPIRNAAFQTFNTWGVGKKDRDNGVLLLIATADHRTRIEVGRGLGRALTDDAAAKILEQDLAPSLRLGHFREGIDRAVLAIEQRLDTNAMVIAPPAATTATNATTATSPLPTTAPHSTSQPPELKSDGDDRDHDYQPRAWIFLIAPLMGVVWLVMTLLSLRRRAYVGGSGDGDSADNSSPFASMDYGGGGGDFGGGGGGTGGGGDFGGGSSGGGGADGSF